MASLYDWTTARWRNCTYYCSHQSTVCSWPGLTYLLRTCFQWVQNRHLRPRPLYSYIYARLIIVTGRCVNVAVKVVCRYIFADYCLSCKLEIRGRSIFVKLQYDKSSTIVEDAGRWPFSAGKLLTNIELCNNLKNARDIVTSLTLAAPTRQWQFMPLAVSLYGHSTVTALVVFLNGVYTAGNEKQITFVVGLDTSATLYIISK